MNFYENMNEIAGRELSEFEAHIFAVNQWGMICAWMKEKYLNKNEDTTTE